MATATITELPITDSDVTVIPESKSVVLSAQKFYDLLDYLTRLEDELSVAKFDLESERRLTMVLNTALAKSIAKINWASQETDMKALALELLETCEQYLTQEVKDGSISEDQAGRVSMLLRWIAERTANMRYETV